MKVYAVEAHVTGGRVMHAVKVMSLPLPKDRAVKRYRTTCGMLVVGENVYRKAFVDPHAGIRRCARCMRLIERSLVAVQPGLPPAREPS